MSLDIFQSRVNFNELCRWWTRNESDTYEPDDLIIKRIASGQFHAREVSAEIRQDAVAGNEFMFDKTTITIKSPDDLSMIKNRDLVEFQGEIWNVQNVQKTKAKIQNTFFADDKHCSHYWYLELRK